jgi:hypothetical protein
MTRFGYFLAGKPMQGGLFYGTEVMPELRRRTRSSG